MGTERGRGHLLSPGPTGPCPLLCSPDPASPCSSQVRLPGVPGTPGCPHPSGSRRAGQHFRRRVPTGQRRSDRGTTPPPPRLSLPAPAVLGGHRCTAGACTNHSPHGSRHPHRAARKRTARTPAHSSEAAPRGRGSPPGRPAIWRRARPSSSVPVGDLALGGCVGDRGDRARRPAHPPGSAKLIIS